MRRWFLAAALATAALGTTALVYSDDARKPAKADGELAKAKAKYDADVKGKEDEIRKARTAEEADDLKKELREFKAIELDGLLDVAVKEPGSDMAFEIFSDLVFGGFDEMKSKIARAMIEKHHLEQPHVKEADPQVHRKAGQQGRPDPTCDCREEHGQRLPWHRHVRPRGVRQEQDAGRRWRSQGRGNENRQELLQQGQGEVSAR